MIAHAPGWTRWRTLVTLASRHADLSGPHPPARAQLQALLDSAGVDLRVVPPAPRGTYEARVAGGELPCRDDSWHDAFNAVAFATFPRAKQALHARVLALRRERDGVAPTPTRTRTREEDALTLLDETCVLLAARADDLAGLNAAREGNDLPEIDRLICAQRVHARWFGHALIEHLVLDRAPISAGVLAIAIPAVPPEHATIAIDTALAQTIAGGELTTPRFAPNLPWPHPLVDCWCA